MTQQSDVEAFMSLAIDATTPDTDAAFLRLYADRLRNGNSWDVPETIARAVEAIAARMSAKT